MNPALAVTYIKFKNVNPSNKTSGYKDLTIVCPRFLCFQMRLPFTVLIVSALSSILIINQVVGTKGQYEKVLEKGREHRREEQAGAVNAGNSAIGWRRKRNIRGEEPARICLFTKSSVRAIFD